LTVTVIVRKNFFIILNWLLWNCLLRWISKFFLHVSTHLFDAEKSFFLKSDWSQKTHIDKRREKTRNRKKRYKNVKIDWHDELEKETKNMKHFCHSIKSVLLHDMTYLFSLFEYLFSLLIDIYCFLRVRVRRSYFMRLKFNFFRRSNYRSWGWNSICSWDQICSLIFDSFDQEVVTSTMRSKLKKALLEILISWLIC
jgi:hypothetical protein